MTTVFRAWRLGMVIGATALACGCGGEKPPLVAVHGRVTYQGKPLPNLLLHFIPLDGRPGIAVTDSNGVFPFVAYTDSRKGVLVGEYSIVVQYLPPEPEAGAPLPAVPPQPPEELHPLLEKYGDFQKPKITERITPETRELVFNLTN